MIISLNAGGLTFSPIVLTKYTVPKLPTDNIRNPPGRIDTHCSPGSVGTYFYSSFK